MPYISIGILTTPKLFDRCLLCLQHLKGFVEHGGIDQIFVESSCNDARLSRGLHYDPNLWSLHINTIRDILTRNIAIIESNSSNTSFVDSYIRLSSLDIYDFRPRILTATEHSIVNGHMNLIYRACHSDLCIFLEDDALFEIFDDPAESKNFFVELKYFATLDKGVYVDLNDDYLPRRHLDSHHFSNLPGYQSYPVGLTRTASAYALNRHAINAVIRESASYSLPYDLHLQYVLRKTRILGYSKTKSLFKHASKNGMFKSSTST